MSESNIPGQTAVYKHLCYEIEQVTGCASWVYVPEDKTISFSANFSRLFKLAVPATTLIEISTVIDPADEEKLYYTQRCMQEGQMVPSLGYKALIDGKPCTIKQWGRKYVAAQKDFIAGFFRVAYSPERYDYETQPAPVAPDLQLYKMAVDTCTEGMLILDTELEIVALNRMCALVTGMDQEVVTGKNYLRAFPGITDAGEMLAVLNNVLKGHSVFLPVGSLVTNGFYECRFLPVKKNTGEVAGILHVIYDVAHRVKTEQQLDALNEALSMENKVLRQRNEELALLIQPRH